MRKLHHGLSFASKRARTMTRVRTHPVSLAAALNRQESRSTSRVRLSVRPWKRSEPECGKEVVRLSFVLLRFLFGARTSTGFFTALFTAQLNSALPCFFPDLSPRSYESAYIALSSGSWHGPLRRVLTRQRALSISGTMPTLFPGATIASLCAPSRTGMFPQLVPSVIRCFKGGPRHRMTAGSCTSRPHTRPLSLVESDYGGFLGAGWASGPRWGFDLYRLRSRTESPWVDKS